MTPPYRYSIVACARWETRYITEWLTYYVALGFDHVFLYCNDDDPAELYRQVLPFVLGPAPFVTFRHYPHQGQQAKMYGHFLQNNLDETEWVSFFDIDEFLRLPAGESIEQFMRRFDDTVDCVMFNWIFFSPNGHKTPPAGSVLENFTRRDVAIHPLTKYVAKASAFTGDTLFHPHDAHAFWHSLIDKVATPIKAVNVLGDDMQNYQDEFPEAAAKFVNSGNRHDRILQTAIIHHYAFRSEQAFLERSARGLAGAFEGQSMWQTLAESENFEGYLASISKVSDVSLAEFWATLSLRAKLTNVLGRAAGGLLSKNRAATQSSVSEWSRGPTVEQDAGGAVNGQIDGVRKFHTGLETDPWWQVDLGGSATIREIRIYNTIDSTAFRFRNFSLSVSIDGVAWVEITRKQDDQTVGSILSTPFIWNGPGTAWARFVRVTLLGRDFLHLDQVEVYGEFQPG